MFFCQNSVYCKLFYVNTFCWLESRCERNNAILCGIMCWTIKIVCRCFLTQNPEVRIDVRGSEHLGKETVNPSHAYCIITLGILLWIAFLIYSVNVSLPACIREHYFIWFTFSAHHWDPFVWWQAVQHLLISDFLIWGLYVLVQCIAVSIRFY
jgi:hypothetical protein